MEQHWRVRQVAERLNVSRQTVTRMFEELPGVKVVGERCGSRKRRKYRTLLIPESVVQEQCSRLE